MAKILKKIQKHLKRNIDNREITLEEMQKLIKNGAIVIDVRSMQEYNEGHVDGAISIPEYEIDEKIKDNIQEDEQIVLYCSSGSRSRRAKKKLEEFGYKNVYNLKDGWI